jgi:hypothetical protein
VRVRRMAPVVVLAVAAAGLTAFQSGPAHAAAVTGLPITSVYQVVAASAQGHIFISQGPEAGTDAPIVVTNLSGTPITTIGDGARGLALSANDETLYAATGDTVTAFSTTTLKETASYPLPGPGFSLALQGSSLWVGYQSSLSGQVGDIDLATGTATWNVLPGGWVNSPPAIALDPSGTGVLVTSSEGENPPWVTTYNVSNPSAVTQIATATEMGCPNDGLSVLPGGKTFLCDGLLFSTTTLAEDTSASYDGGFTAVAPDGAVALGGSEAVQAYPPGATAPPTADYEGFYGLSLPPGFQVNSSDPVGFAWSANSQQLFTLIESTSEYSPNPVYTLLALSPFEKVPANLTLTSTATTVQYGAAATITAHLGFTYGPPDFSVYETIAGQPRRLLWSGEIEPSNTITLPDSSFTRNATFTATFGGDSLYDPATVTLGIKVGAKITDSLSGYYKSTTVAGLEYRLYHRNATLKDLVTVAPSKTGECVRFELQKSTNGVWRPDTISGCAALNKWSQTMLTRKLGSTGWYRFRPDFTASAKDTTNVSTDGGWLYYVVPS